LHDQTNNRHVLLLADARRSGIATLPEFPVDVGLRNAPEPTLSETDMAEPLPLQHEVDRSEAIAPGGRIFIIS
jgi:hypothetical protein